MAIHVEIVKPVVTRLRAALEDLRPSWVTTAHTYGHVERNDRNELDGQDARQPDSNSQFMRKAVKRPPPVNIQ